MSTQQIEKAAQMLRSEGNRKVLSFYRLNEIVQALPAPAEGNDYATFLIFEATDWLNGNEPSVSTKASFRGCETALETAALLLCALRSLRAVDEKHSKIKATYQLVLSVENTVNSKHAWLDCETGNVKTGKAWPKADVVPLSEERLAILDHTVHRAAGGRYCGGSADMDALVNLGLMQPIGCFIGNPYFGITATGREALRETKTAQVAVTA